MRCAVTGANGFIGRALCPYLTSLGYEVVPLIRKLSHINGAKNGFNVSELSQLLENCKSVVHLAGYSQTPPHGISKNILRHVNVDLTLELAKLAAKMGVTRFIYISSVKVNGENTLNRKAFSADDPHNPLDEYARSKADAELALHRVSKETGLNIVIIRPPIVYGPEVTGNFLKLIKLSNIGLPLPLKSMTAKRALIAIDNLIDFIALCADPNRSRNADGRTFLISDGIDLSVATILEKISRAYHHKLRLFTIPIDLLKIFARVTGNSNVFERLAYPMRVDITTTMNLLGWSPIITTDQQLIKMALSPRKF
jgi:nucleoside-diphosphate-sugar epimerase